MKKQKRVPAKDVAKWILNGELENFGDDEFIMCGTIKKLKRKKLPVKKRTLTERVVKLESDMAALRSLPSDVAEIKSLLLSFINDTNEHFKRIEQRLDYNNLKPLPESNNSN